MQFLGQFMYSDLLIAQNASVTIPKLSVNREVHCCLWENEPSSDSIHIVEEYNWVVLEQNPVQDTLAALLVHSQSCTMKSTVDGNK